VLHYERAIGDLDGDGKNDILAVERKKTLIWYKYPNWSPLPVIALGTAFFAADDLRLADMDKDGDLDIVEPLATRTLQPAARLFGGKTLAPPNP